MVRDHYNWCYGRFSKYVLRFFQKIIGILVEILSYNLSVRLFGRPFGRKLVSIDGKFLEDSNAPKIVKIGAIQSQFGPFFENLKLGKNEHWYDGTLVLENKISWCIIVC